METRGRGTSTTKFCKDGSPKHAGNWSESTIHHQSLVTKDYYVKRHTIPMEDCLKETLIVVGNHENRPLTDFLPESVVTYIVSDPFIKTIMREGKVKFGAKEYECFKEIKKTRYKYLCGCEYILRLGIYTDNEIKWEFPEF